MSAIKKTDDSGRQVLPKNVKPIEYTLKLEPNFETFIFDGDELLELEVVEDSDFISLNTLEIDIKETILLTASGKEIKPESVKEDKEEQYTTFKFSPASSLKKGDHVKLSIKFVGELNDKMAGFYRSTYEEDGKTNILLQPKCNPLIAEERFHALMNQIRKLDLVLHLSATRLSHICPTWISRKSISLMIQKKKLYSIPPLKCQHIWLHLL